MAEKGQLSLDVQAFLVWCFVRIFSAYLPEDRQRRCLDFIWGEMGCGAIHGGHLTAARRRLVDEPFVPTTLKEDYLHALLVLEPERDPHELVRGPVFYAFGSGMHSNTIHAVLELMRRKPLNDLDRAWAREVIAKVQSFKPRAHDDATMALL
jgi:hypothetical protein